LKNMSSFLAIKFLYSRHISLKILGHIILTVALCIYSATWYSTHFSSIATEVQLSSYSTMQCSTFCSWHFLHKNGITHEDSWTCGWLNMYVPCSRTEATSLE
jgi:hypothetical protein